MTVSDANPIQFWPTGEETYNEKEICGVYKECYCQKFNCDDTIKTQILAPSGGQFQLRLEDESGGTVHTEELLEIDTGVYESEFNYASEVDGSSFFIAPSSWSNEGTAFSQKTSTQLISIIPISTAVNHGAKQTINVPIGGLTDAFNIIINSSGSGFPTSDPNSYGFQVTVTFKNSGGGLTASVSTPIISMEQEYIFNIPAQLNQTAALWNELVIELGAFMPDGDGYVSMTMPDVGDVIYDPDSCGGIVQGKIYDVSQIGALAGFTNRSHSFVVDTFGNWTLGSNPTITLGSTNVSALAIENFPSFTGNTYIIEYGCDFGANGANLYIVLLDENYNLTHVLPSIPESGLDEVVDTIEITPTSNGSYIAFFIQNGGVVNTFTMHTLEVLSPTETELYHSDCIEFKEDHECTQLITYSNSKNFDGLVFETVGSPTTGSFNLRIPAQFYQEGEPMEQEDHEKSNGEITTLRQSVQSKRLLEIGYMPGYMHRKLRRVLMMSSILIDGKYWKRRDSYDDNPVKRYTMKKASVWLTEYNSVKKNTL